MHNAVNVIAATAVDNSVDINNGDTIVWAAAPAPNSARQLVTKFEKTTTENVT